MYGCAKDNSKKEQIFPAIMRTNCNTFSFRDCCFLIQKDREGASRVKIVLFRLLYGKNLTLSTVLLLKFRSVVLMQASINTNISIWITIEQWLKPSALQFSIYMSPNKLKSSKCPQTWSRTFSSMRNSAMMILAEMIPTTRIKIR